MAGATTVPTPAATLRLAACPLQLVAEQHEDESADARADREMTPLCLAS
jgi:hypothetical protein